MTGPEKEDFRELRQEMREGFADLKSTLTSITARIDSLESTRDQEAGAESERERGRSAFIWKVGIIVSVLTTAAIISGNVLITLLSQGTVR